MSNTLNPLSNSYSLMPSTVVTNLGNDWAFVFSTCSKSMQIMKDRSMFRMVKWFVLKVIFYTNEKCLWDKKV